MLMAVTMSPRERWTDERLDDLSAKVDRGFSELKTEMREGFARMETLTDKRFNQIERRQGQLEEAFFALNRTLWGGGFVIIAAIIGSSIF